MSVKIAIVDDEIIALKLFEISFKKEVRSGEICLYTFNTAEKLFAFLKEEGDEVVFILSDINMPVIDGFEVLKYVKNNYPHIKVGMESAYAQQEFVEKANSLGAEMYLTKPIDFQAVKRILEPFYK
jgi:YesN/AraC family two-component response regulator